MSTRGDILRRAAQVEPDAVPEPWRSSDDEDALATVSDREHYRRNLVTLPDGAGEVPAYVWDFPRTPTIPDEVREEWTRGSAGRVLEPNGKYVSRGSDTPRLSYDGEEPGLLVEAAGRTNHHRYSTSFTSSNYIDLNVKLGNNSEPSIIDGENVNATHVQGQNSDSGAAFFRSHGLFSSSDEVLSIIVEKSNAGEVGARVKDKTTGNNIATFNYKFDGNKTSLGGAGGEVDANARTLTPSGPNGGRVVWIVFRYDPSASSAGGNERRVFHRPDTTGSNDYTYYHHAQIEEAPNASSPIVTQNSPTTRAADDYAISVSDWYNTSEGTFFVEFDPLVYNVPPDHFEILSIDGATPIVFYLNPGDPFVMQTFTGGGNTLQESNASVNAFSTSKAALSYNTNANFRVLSSNGSSVSDDKTNGYETVPTNIRIGADNRELMLYKKILYYPRALPESTLNTLTS